MQRTASSSRCLSTRILVKNGQSPLFPCDGLKFAFCWAKSPACFAAKGMGKVPFLFSAMADRKLDDEAGCQPWSWKQGLVDSVCADCSGFLVLDPCRALAMHGCKWLQKARCTSWSQSWKQAGLIQFVLTVLVFWSWVHAGHHGCMWVRKARCTSWIEGLDMLVPRSWCLKGFQGVCLCVCVFFCLWVWPILANCFGKKGC